MSRSCNFAFTHNNYTPDDIMRYTFLKAKYIVYGKETSPTTGTPHLQGTIVFPSQKTLPQAIKLLPGKPHVEICLDLFASIEYCKKGGDITEHGIPPVPPKEKGKKEQRRWLEYKDLARQGRFDELPPDIQFRNLNLIKAHRADYLLHANYPDTTEKMQWYYGESGTGKSRKARGDHPNAYLKMCNKWWDGYNEEEVVIIEDFDSKHDVLCHHLKIWADRYPFPGEFKGGARKLRPRLLIVTSNYHPNQIWFKDEDLNPILRRFHVTRFSLLPGTNE